MRKLAKRAVSVALVVCIAVGALLVTPANSVYADEMELTPFFGEVDAEDIDEG